MFLLPHLQVLSTDHCQVANQVAWNTDSDKAAGSAWQEGQSGLGRSGRTSYRLSYGLSVFALGGGHC